MRWTTLPLRRTCRIVVYRNAELSRELNELKLEHAALDRQLLDAVTQKLQLSQQLEAWQVGHQPQHVTHSLQPLTQSLPSVL